MKKRNLIAALVMGIIVAACSSDSDSKARMLTVAELTAATHADLSLQECEKFEFTYDQAGRLAERRGYADDALLSKTLYEYADAAGDRVRCIKRYKKEGDRYPLSIQEEYTYYSSGKLREKLVSKGSAAGQGTSYLTKDTYRYTDTGRVCAYTTQNYINGHWRDNYKWEYEGDDYEGWTYRLYNYDTYRGQLVCEGTYYVDFEANKHGYWELESRFIDRGRRIGVYQCLTEYGEEGRVESQVFSDWNGVEFQPSQRVEYVYPEYGVQAIEAAPVPVVYAMSKEGKWERNDGEKTKYANFDATGYPQSTTLGGATYSLTYAYVKERE